MLYLHNLVIAICCILKMKYVKIYEIQVKNAFAFLTFSDYNGYEAWFM